VDEPKDGLYHDQYLADQVFLVAIKRFLGVCIKRPMVFFTVVMAWSMKGFGGPLLCREGVGGIAMSRCNLYFKACCYCT